MFVVSLLLIAQSNLTFYENDTGSGNDFLLSDSLSNRTMISKYNTDADWTPRLGTYECTNPLPLANLFNDAHWSIQYSYCDPNMAYLPLTTALAVRGKPVVISCLYQDYFKISDRGFSYYSGASVDQY